MLRILQIHLKPCYSPNPLIGKVVGAWSMAPSSSPSSSSLLPSQSQVVTKKTILFAISDTFAPTCSQKHLPGFVEKPGKLKAKGVDTIACISVNDAFVFVMKAWKADMNIDDEVLLLSDGNGDFTRALGVTLDLSDKPVGLGVRSRRYALLAKDGIVKVLNLEEGEAFSVNSAEDMLKAQ